MNERARQIAAQVLSHELQGLSSAEQLARGVELVFSQFYRLMVDVIGESGFGALLARAVHLTKREVPWIQSIELRPGKDFELERLSSVLEQEGAEAGTAGAVELLACLLGLLFSLIGEQLTLRLVRRIWSIDDDTPRRPGGAGA